MEMLTREQVRELCQEALETADQHGVHEALDYLIGEKFYEVFRELRKAENSVRFVYGSAPSEQVSASPAGTVDKQALKLNYTITVNQNYKAQLHQMKSLERVRDFFVQEIKEVFETADIQDYLSSYPALGAKRSTGFRDWSGNEKVSAFSVEEVLAEAGNVFIVEEMKKLFAS